MLGRDHCHITVLYKEGEELFGTLHIEEWAQLERPQKVPKLAWRDPLAQTPGEKERGKRV